MYTFTYLPQQSYDRIATPIPFPSRLFLSNLHLLTNDKIVGKCVCMVVIVYQRIGSAFHMLSKKSCVSGRDTLFKRLTVVSLQNSNRILYHAINTGIA